MHLVNQFIEVATQINDYYHVIPPSSLNGCSSVLRKISCTLCFSLKILLHKGAKIIHIISYTFIRHCTIIITVRPLTKKHITALH